MACLDSKYWSANILPFKCSVCVNQKVNEALFSQIIVPGYLPTPKSLREAAEPVHEQGQQQIAAALKEGGQAGWERIKKLCLSEGMRQLERVCRNTMDSLLPLFCVNIYSLCMVLSKITICLLPLRSCREK